MDSNTKRDQLLQILRELGSCAVAFSGGLDSSVLAKAAQLALGDRAVAVTAVSESMPHGELEACRALARQIGIRHEVVQTQELSNPDYQRNEGDRCYHCKLEILRQIEEVARQLNLAVVIDGANLDDQSDYRPGLQAARERHVRSPLAECGLTKAEIRQLATDWELPTWNKPSMPCLSSRIAYGEPITAERLAMIDQAEQFLRARGFQPLRVRYHKGDAARIEIALAALPQLLDASLREALIAHFKSLGFKFIALDLEGFRSGSLNDLLPKG